MGVEIAKQEAQDEEHQLQRDQGLLRQDQTTYQQRGESQQQQGDSLDHGRQRPRRQQGPPQDPRQQAPPLQPGLAPATQLKQDYLRLWRRKVDVASIKLLTFLTDLLHATHFPGDKERKVHSPVSEEAHEAFNAAFDRVEDLLVLSPIPVPPSPHYRNPAFSSPSPSPQQQQEQHMSLIDQLDDASDRYLLLSKTLQTASRGSKGIALGKNPSISMTTVCGYDQAICSLRELMFHVQAQI